MMNFISNAYRNYSAKKANKPRKEKHKRQHKKSIFNRIVDSFNRLVRPFLMMVVILFFAYAFEHPFYFQIVMTALSSTPSFVAQIIMMVITMFGIGKSIKDWRGTDYMDNMMEEGIMQTPLAPIAPIVSPLVQATIQSAPSTKHICDDVAEVPDDHINNTVQAWKNRTNAI